MARAIRAATPGGSRVTSSIFAIAIEHVGSTAVPGLVAKPVIDVDIVVGDEHVLPEVIDRLGSLGYVHEGNHGGPGREAFRTSASGLAHHLYAVVIGSRPYCDHVLLRDYLRRHPDEARAYGAFETAAAVRFRHDRDGYAAAKRPVIEALLRRAAEEFGTGV